jgi:hypothetical protein
MQNQNPEQRSTTFEYDDIDWAILPSADGPFKKEELYVLLEFSKPIYTNFSLFPLANYYNVSYQVSHKESLFQSQKHYTPHFKYLHASELDILKNMGKTPISDEKNKEIYFLPLKGINDNDFNHIFINHSNGGKLKSNKQIREWFQANDCTLSFKRYTIPTTFTERITTVNAISPVRIGFFDYRVHFSSGASLQKLKLIPEQISQLFIEDFNTGKVENVTSQNIKPIMEVIPEHINSIVLKGKVFFKKIITQLPDHIHEIILSNDFKLFGGVKDCIDNIPPHVKQIGIEADTTSIRHFLDHFSRKDCTSPISAIRLFQGVTTDIIRQIPEHFTTIYLTPNTEVSTNWTEVVLDNLSLKNRKSLTISYPVGLMGLKPFQDIPDHLATDNVHFIQHVAPEHTHRFIADKPFNLYSRMLWMPGVRKQTIAAMQSAYPNKSFEILIYAGLDPNIVNALPRNSRNIIFCLSGKSTANQDLIQAIPDKFILGVDFSHGSDTETAQAISAKSFADGITIFITEMSNIKAMKAFFNRLTQHRENDLPMIEVIDIVTSSRNIEILKKIPRNLAQTNFKLSTFDPSILEILSNKIFRLTFDFATNAFPTDTRDETYVNLNKTLQKFTHLKEVNFDGEINHQILQTFASIPTVKKISLFHPIKDMTDVGIKKFINILKILGSIDELILYNNDEFCKKLINHPLMRAAKLKFRILSDDKVLYKPSKPRPQKRQRQSADIPKNAPPSKKRKLPPRTFFTKPESDDDDDMDITSAMDSDVATFLRK